MRMNITPDQINLLYIEDDNAIVDLITDYLKSFRHTKFNIISKRSLKEGLDYLDKECRLEDNCDVDAILLDLMLPNSSGVDTFVQIKKKCDFLPIVIISEHEEIACECVKEGAQDYLLKKELSAGLLVRSLKYSIERTALESRIKNVITTSSLGYHMYELIDDKLIFVGYNPASNNILDVDNSEFIGKEINTAFPDLPKEVEIHYREALDGIPWVNQKIEYGDEKIKTAIFRVNAYKTSENFLTVTFEDVTEKMRIKETLNDTLIEYKNLIEVTGAGIYGIDFVNNKFTYVNDVMCKQLGYTKKELMGMGPTNILTEDSLNIWAERFAALGRGDFIDDNIEYEATRKDGSAMWVLVTAQYVEDNNKNIIGANVVAIDITAKKTAEIALEQKEVEVYTELESKIQTWKQEMTQRNVEKDQRLQLIDTEILLMTRANGIEVS